MTFDAERIRKRAEEFGIEAFKNNLSLVVKEAIEAKNL
jgi:hypothetical protein